MSLIGLIQDQNPWWTQPEARHRRRIPRQRQVADHIARHLLVAQPPPALVLVGPRQVGKTTALKHAIDQILDRLDAEARHRRVVYFDFADDRLRGEGMRDVLEAVREIPGPRYLLFDEVQRLQRWDETLRFLVDHASETALLRPADRLVLTGSGARELRRGSRESGPGRWTERFLEPLSFREYFRLAGPSDVAFGDDLFQRYPRILDDFLVRGGFPGWIGVEPEARARRLLREMVTEKTVAQDLADADIDVVAASRLLAYLCEMSGAKFVARKHAIALGSGVGVGYDERSVARWRRELEQTGLVLALPRWTPNSAARTRSKDKLYAVDHSLVIAYSALALPTRDFEVMSRVYETLVFRQLRALVTHDAGSYQRDSVSYVDHKRREVDFAVRLGDRLILVEVTSSARTEKKVAQARRMGRELGADHVCVVHGGTERRFDDGVQALPLHQFVVDPHRVLESG